jgi:hypothetical protein
MQRNAFKKAIGEFSTKLRLAVACKVKMISKRETFVEGETLQGIRKDAGGRGKGGYDKVDGGPGRKEAEKMLDDVEKEATTKWMEAQGEAWNGWDHLYRVTAEVQLGENLGRVSIPISSTTFHIAMKQCRFKVSTLMETKRLVSILMETKRTLFGVNLP